MAFGRIIAGFVASVIAATAAGSAFHTTMVIDALEKAGATTDLPTRFGMMVSDFAGLAPQFGAVIAIGLLIAFLVAAGLRRVFKPLAGIAYPLAGAAALVAALTLMSIQFDGITPIAGARGTIGMALQALAGAIGGFVFAALAVRKP